MSARPVGLGSKAGLLCMLSSWRRAAMEARDQELRIARDHMQRGDRYNARLRMHHARIAHRAAFLGILRSPAR